MMLGACGNEPVVVACCWRGSFAFTPHLGTNKHCSGRYTASVIGAWNVIYFTSTSAHRTLGATPLMLIHKCQGDGLPPHPPMPIAVTLYRSR